MTYVPLKPIETRYNGYRFRSRLEARWAVFFDALGIAYEYEKEGLDLNGVWYLPDFYLPRRQMWVEIKPGGCDDVSVMSKCDLLARYSKNWTILVTGEPYQGRYSVELFNILPFEPGRKYPFELWLVNERTQFQLNSCTGRALISPAVETPVLLSAYEKARGARFEYGEEGKS